MRVLIIGGGGYLGTALVKSLKSDGSVSEICVFDCFKYSNETFLPRDIETICDDLKNIENHKKKIVEFDFIYYLASPRLDEITTEEEIEEHLGYLINTLNIIENRDIRLIFTSSCSVYGQTNEKVNEFSPTQVTSPYSDLKIRSENLLLEKNDPKFKVVRLSTLFGVSRLNRPDVFINNIVHDIKKNGEVEIYDPDSIRPHLYVGDCANLLRHFCCGDFIEDERILNLGKDEMNISKRFVVDFLKNESKLDFSVEFFDTKDSRYYFVDFSRLNERHHWVPTPFNTCVNDLITDDRVVCSIEEWDTLLSFYRPNISSKSWYLNEEGSLNWPKQWGAWNVFDVDKHNKLFPSPIIKNNSIYDYGDDVVYLTKPQLNGRNHLHVVNVFDISFFRKNKHIGFNLMSEEYLDDVRHNRSKIVLCLPYEGESGSDGNEDLLILNDWVIGSNLPPENVYYISGNLIIDKSTSDLGYRYNCVPVSIFESWVSSGSEINEVVKYSPVDEKNLYLSYNRNPRIHRIYLVGLLLKHDLLDRGLISMGRFKNTYGLEIIEGLPVNDLMKMLPLTIDRDLTHNWAYSITIEDHEKTFISLVTETLTTNSTVFFSEKIWKPISVGHPFILVGNKGSLSYLKDMGYKTFGNWIDESYDEEINEEKRMDMVLHELIRLSNHSVDELIRIRGEMNEICLHNKNVFKERLTKRFGKKNGGYNSDIPIINILKQIWKSWK